MRYYLPEYLDKFNYPNAPDYEELNEKWQFNCDAYWKQFLLIEKKLQPKLKDRLKNGFFHDALIEDIILKKNVKGVNVWFDFILRLKGYNYHGELVHSKVTELKTSLKGAGDHGEIGNYLYGEVLQGENGMWTHDFLFTRNNEINIKCQNILWDD